jgi:hypothetical protein
MVVFSCYNAELLRAEAKFHYAVNETYPFSGPNTREFLIRTVIWVRDSFGGAVFPPRRGVDGDESP